MLKKHINAVKRTIKMWEWLRDNPDETKENYLENIVKSDNLTEHSCYLCYYWNYTGDCCYDYKSLGNTDCPLDNKISKRCGCPDSPFDRWISTRQKAARRRNAQIIVDLCKDWLKKYEE